MDNTNNKPLTFDELKQQFDLNTADLRGPLGGFRKKGTNASLLQQSIMAERAVESGALKSAASTSVFDQIAEISKKAISADAMTSRAMLDQVEVLKKIADTIVQHESESEYAQLKPILDAVSTNLKANGSLVQRASQYIGGKTPLLADKASEIFETKYAGMLINGLVKGIGFAFGRSSKNLHNQEYQRDVLLDIAHKGKDELSGGAGGTVASATVTTAEKVTNIDKNIEKIVKATDSENKKTSSIEKVLSGQRTDGDTAARQADLMADEDKTLHDIESAEEKQGSGAEGRGHSMARGILEDIFGGLLEGGEIATMMGGGGIGKKLLMKIVPFAGRFLLKAVMVGLKAIPWLGLIFGLFEGFKAGFEEYKKTGSITKAIWAGIKGFANGLIEFFSFGFLDLKKVTNILEPVMDMFFKYVVDPIVDFFKFAWNVFAAPFKAAWEIVTGLYHLFADYFTGSIKRFKELKAHFSVDNLWKFVKEQFGAVIDLFLGIFKTIFSGIKHAFGYLFGQTQELADKQKERNKDFADDASKTLDETWQAVKNGGDKQTSSISSTNTADNFNQPGKLESGNIQDRMKKVFTKDDINKSLEADKKMGLAPGTMLGVWWRESHFDTGARSPTGALGLGQMTSGLTKDVNAVRIKNGMSPLSRDSRNLGDQEDLSIGGMELKAQLAEKMGYKPGTEAYYHKVMDLYSGGAAGGDPNYAGNVAGYRSVALKEANTLLAQSMAGSQPTQTKTQVAQANVNAATNNTTHNVAVTPSSVRNGDSLAQQHTAAGSVG